MFNELSIKSLLKDFSPNTKKDWLKVAQRETQHNAIDKLTENETNELFSRAYYDKQDRENLRIKNNFYLNAAQENFHGARAWLNQPAVSVSDDETANQEALLHLQNGADGILFKCSKTPDFKILLKDIQLEYCHIALEIPNIQLVNTFVKYCKIHCLNPEKISCSLIWKKIPDDVGSIFNSFSDLKKFLPLGISIEHTIDPIEEIVNTLCSGVNLIDSLTEKGFEVDKIFPMIFFSLESGSQIFSTIAKLKALRMLWYQIVCTYGAKQSYDDIYLHVRCEAFNNEHYAPQANMIHSPIAALASVLGGCQSLTINSSDPTKITSKRITRNISSILREESHINVVADPLAGSYFIDSLVESMAEKAWKKFQDKMIRNEA